MADEGAGARATLRGRVCVLAGGTGGLGSHLAGELHREGALLVLGYRQDRERAEAVKRDLEATGDAPVVLVGGDLADEQVRASVLLAARRLGEPYALVVLAGNPARPAGAAPTQAELESSFRQNYVGPVMLARLLGEVMVGGRVGGTIVMVSSMQGVAPFEGSIGYAGPKAALLHAARVMAKEWGGKADVRVNVVAPGVTSAGMAEASIRSGKYDRFLERGVIRRFGRPADVSRAIRFFLEPDGYVTGQVLTVDGGLTLRRDALAG